MGGLGSLERENDDPGEGSNASGRWLMYYKRGHERSCDILNGRCSGWMTCGVWEQVERGPTYFGSDIFPLIGIRSNVASCGRTWLVFLSLFSILEELFTMCFKCLFCLSYSSV